MTKAELLAQVEDVLRTMPPATQFGPNEEALMWLGRAVATLERWNYVYMPSINHAAAGCRDMNTYRNAAGYSQIRMLLYQARADLQMEVGQLSVVVQSGQVFEYFDELRKLVETARDDLFFVDPYLDAEFVSRYLSHAAPGVGIRLLASPKKLSTLLPAVNLFANQQKCALELRTSEQLHDRYLFVDRNTCYLSGASFKDGAKNAPAVLTQITDGFQAMWNTYDSLWDAATKQQ